MKKLQLSQDLLEEIKNRKDIDVDTALKLNAALLDSLHRLSLVVLTEDEFAFLESRLRKVPLQIEGYLLEMWKNVRSKNVINPTVENAQPPHVSVSTVTVVLPKSEVNKPSQL